MNGCTSMEWPQVKRLVDQHSSHVWANGVSIIAAAKLNCPGEGENISENTDELMQVPAGTAHVERITGNDFGVGEA